MSQESHICVYKSDIKHTMKTENMKLMTKEENRDKKKKKKAYESHEE